MEHTLEKVQEGVQQLEKVIIIFIMEIFAFCKLGSITILSMSLNPTYLLCVHLLQAEKHQKRSFKLIAILILIFIVILGIVIFIIVKVVKSGGSII